MLLSLSHVSAREADRGKLAEATERFLAQGREIERVEAGACADIGRLTRVYTINPKTKEGRPRKTPGVKPKN